MNLNSVVIAYHRISTSVQEKSGLSQREQQSDIAKFCSLRGLTIHETTSDVMSGSVKAQDRPGLKRAIDMLEAGLAGGLIVTKLDRLGRNSADTIALIDMLNERKYNFFSVKENIDCTTVVGQAMIGLLCVFANMERSLAKERTQTVLDGKRSRNELCGRCPFGMEARPNSKGIKVLHPNAEEQETVRLAQHLRARIITRTLRNGKERKSPMTYKDIGAELVRLGRHNRGGEAKWYPSQVMALMKIKLAGEDEKEDTAVEDEAEEEKN